ncbi:MAG: histidine kinase [Solidesulfovibrio magneticus str. Maddingley MBC34]|uniref:histidine kinase n=1 Tax=Solidesulfovibrio magneticus str. Maddingley MBC34 TaxID=1206767 RepID=K6GS42_9BACT|nr:MAG: histidine kinase [Solidesulfovibrio magneticus str. Maddingley MBC34]
MKWWRTASFYFRINVVIVSSVLLLSVALSGVVFVHNRMLLEKELDKRGAEIGNSIAAMGSESIILDERFVLHEIAAKTRRTSDDIRYIMIVDYAGEILAHTFGDGFPAGLPLELPPGLPRPDAGGEGAYAVTRYRSNEGPFREVVVPVERGAVGYVRVGLTEQDMRHILEKNIKNFSLITLVVCLLAAVVATRLAYRIVHPIDQLAQAAGQIRQGNYGVRIIPDDQAEVGRLAAAFNDMAAALTRKDDENEHLLTALRDKDALHVRLLQKVISVQEDERKRISRELHDEAGQSLASLLAYLQLLLAGEVTSNQREAIRQLKSLVVEILGGLRKMAVELRPPALDDLGLVPAMAKYVDSFALQRDLTAIFAPEDDNPELDPAVALALYRILQESLTNVARHAQAKAVRVELAAEGGEIALTVSDDGRGFDATTLPAMLQGEGSLGIYGMMERAELLDGTFRIESRPGQGTTVRVTLPRRLG